MEKLSNIIGEHDTYAKIFHLSPNPQFISYIYIEPKFLEVNKAFEVAVGLPKEKIIGKSSFEIGCWVKKDDYYNYLNKLKKEKSVLNYETAIRTHGGRLRMGLITSALIELNNSHYIIGVINDITERKDLESGLVKLDHYYTLLEMSASISHEVRNPMTTVRGFLQLLKNSEKKCSDYQDTFILMIEELDRANNLISDFLNISHKKERIQRPVNINMVIKKLLPLLLANAIRVNKFIKTEFCDYLPDLMVNEEEIIQLLLNLVKNALEATSDNGYITILTSVIDDKVLLSIKDQGEGIAPEILIKLGTPFFTTKEGGTGLGLAISKRIIERHNAQLQIETSTLGTTFNVVFSCC